MKKISGNLFAFAANWLDDRGKRRGIARSRERLDAVMLE
jgi:hypothetical protein